jgi:hypothetical protein
MIWEILIQMCTGPPHMFTIISYSYNLLVRPQYFKLIITNESDGDVLANLINPYPVNVENRVS